MKRQFTKLCIAVLALVALVSCGNSEEKKVKTTAMNYLTAMKEADYQKAKEYATPETGKLLDFIYQLAGQDTAAIAQAREASKDIKIEIIEVKIDNDKADVTYTQEDKNKDVNNETQGEGEKRNETVTLKKVDGKWFVHQPKEDNGTEDEGLVEEEEVVETNDIQAAE